MKTIDVEASVVKTGDGRAITAKLDELGAHPIFGEVNIFEVFDGLLFQHGLELVVFDTQGELTDIAIIKRS